MQFTMQVGCDDVMSKVYSTSYVVCYKIGFSPIYTGGNKTLFDETTLLEHGFKIDIGKITDMSLAITMLPFSGSINSIKIAKLKFLFSGDVVGAQSG